MKTYYFVKKNTPTMTTAGVELPVCYIDEWVTDTTRLRSNEVISVDYRLYAETSHKLNKSFDGMKVVKDDGSKLITIDDIPVNPLTFTSAQLYDKIKEGLVASLGIDESELEIISVEM